MMDLAVITLFGICYIVSVLWFGKTLLSGILLLSSKLAERD
jgi:hypothetical protein